MIGFLLPMPGPGDNLGLVLRGKAHGGVGSSLRLEPQDFSLSWSPYSASGKSLKVPFQVSYQFGAPTASI